MAARTNSLATYPSLAGRTIFVSGGGSGIGAVDAGLALTGAG